MSNNNITVFYGDAIENDGERRLLARLRSDLERRGVRGVVYANFFTLAGNQRQIDMLVRTQHRVCHVEVKALNPDRPVVGKPNGGWYRVRSDGSQKNLGKNFYRQALEGTYAISDAMRDLARADEVTPADHFYEHIDTTVCMWPSVPDGSVFEPFTHVDVIGYEDLVDRLITPGPTVPWSEPEWERFTRHLALYREEADSPEARSRRLSAQEVADYRDRAMRPLAADLHELVSVDYELGGEPASASDVTDETSSGLAVLVTGRSGAGKSFLARHVSLELCDRGHLVVWARCGEYEKGHFSRLLARAMAPYSALGAVDLLGKAREIGTGITLVLDGLNECPEELRPELLQQVAAFRLRFPAGVLVTSTVTSDGLDDLVNVTVKLKDPDGEGRTELLKSYGASRPERVSEAFTSPHELAIAAECESDLSESAGLAELHDAYVRRFVESEAVRGALRKVASLLVSELRTAMSLTEVRTLLAGRSGLGLHAGAVDETLSNGLLETRQNRVRFRHELFAQFLAAEELVLTSTDGQELGSRLADPKNEGLRRHAIELESNSHRRSQAMSEVAESSLYEAAIRGELGQAVAQETRAEVASLLVEASSATSPDTAEFIFGDMFSSRWVCARRWTRGERAMLTAVGATLHEGHFVDGVCQLVDRTDAMCKREVEAASGTERDRRVSVLVEATYTQGAQHHEDALPVSFVSVSCELASMLRQLTPTFRSGSTLSR